MRTISLRRFNTEVAGLRESVEIVRRSPDGALITLGYYYPKGIPIGIVADDGFDFDLPGTAVGPGYWSRRSGRHRTESET